MEIRFYSPGRILSIITGVAVTVFLPLIIAAVVRLAAISDTSEKFSDAFRPMYGAAWYVSAGFIAIIYFAKGVRKDVYDHPVFYEKEVGRQKKAWEPRFKKTQYVLRAGSARLKREWRKGISAPGIWKTGRIGYIPWRIPDCTSDGKYRRNPYVKGITEK